MCHGARTGLIDAWKVLNGDELDVHDSLKPFLTEVHRRGWTQDHARVTNISYLPKGRQLMEATSVADGVAIVVY